MEKRLCRVEKGRMIFGVCGGVAEYLNVDPTVVRVIWAILGCCAATGIVAYIIAALLMPTKPRSIEP